MTGLPSDPAAGGGRFPGFSVLSQSDHWDAATAAEVHARLGVPRPVRFFTEAEEACANALCDQLLGMREDPRVPVTAMIDSRLADREFDGWRYEELPPDDEAWRLTLACLDEDAGRRGATAFSELSWQSQHDLLEDIHDLKGEADWHGMPPERVWSLWTRYACSAFYSHPWAWDEMGFPGPAYPRGYKNLGIDRREPFEVGDVRPHDDPLLKEPE